MPTMLCGYKRNLVPEFVLYLEHYVVGDDRRAVAVGVQCLGLCERTRQLVQELCTGAGVRVNDVSGHTLL